MVLNSTLTALLVMQGMYTVVTMAIVITRSLRAHSPHRRVIRPHLFCIAFSYVIISSVVLWALIEQGSLNSISRGVALVVAFVPSNYALARLVVHPFDRERAP